MRRILLPAMILGVMAASLSFTAGCNNGGCAWTKVSPVAVAPATSCLSITVENADGNGSYGGCVTPDLAITNNCTDTLTIEGSDVSLLGADGTPTEIDAGNVTIAAGAKGVIDVTMEKNPEVLSATLGSQSLTLTITTN